MEPGSETFDLADEAFDATVEAALLALPPLGGGMTAKPPLPPDEEFLPPPLA